MEEEELFTFYGCASANGIESIFPDPTHGISSNFGSLIFGEEEAEKKGDELAALLGGMAMYAHANEHRRVVVYRAKMTMDVFETIEDIVKHDACFALLVLKSEAAEVAIMGGARAQKWWGQIPNKDLDPYG